ncbi:MAG: signal recognition particle-docking protein FtsY [Burkholderiales bacterium]
MPASSESRTAETQKPGWLQRLHRGLARTRENLGAQLGRLLQHGAGIDETLYEELENILLRADVGVDATRVLLEQTRAAVKRERMSDASQLRGALRQALIDLLTPLQQPLDTSSHKPFVILLVGVNGAGKTTTIGKLAKLYGAQHKKVLLAAADTFRAAARQQLAEWAARNAIDVIAQRGGDPAAVAFDAVQAARARGVDVLLADTAGRLATQAHLMEEIKKVKRVIAKAEPGAPHEILLVLDANTGQNALAQLNAFDSALQVTGLILTKLDGTAKGGVIAAVARVKQIPMRFIGVGEALDDLQPFVATEFVDALFA